ncbi:MAG: hypothetical protein V3U15_01350 [Nitrospinota bacterium]
MEDLKKELILITAKDAEISAWPRVHNHNPVGKTKLDGFRRKAARRVEAGDGRATKLSLALSSALPKSNRAAAQFTNKNCAKKTQFYRFAVQRFYVLTDILYEKIKEKRIATVQIDCLLGRYSYLKRV